EGRGGGRPRRGGVAPPRPEDAHEAGAALVSAAPPGDQADGPGVDQGAVGGREQGLGGTAVVAQGAELEVGAGREVVTAGARGREAGGAADGAEVHVDRGARGAGQDVRGVAVGVARAHAVGDGDRPGGGGEAGDAAAAGAGGAAVGRVAEDGAVLHRDRAAPARLGDGAAGGGGGVAGDGAVLHQE